MPDWIRRADRALRRELRPGEVVQAAVLVESVDRRPRPHAADHPGQRIGGATFAESLDERVRCLVLTDHRLLVTGLHGLTRRPAGVLGLLRPSDLTRLDVAEAEREYRIVAHFSDGSTREFRAPLRQADPRSFDRELRRRSGRLA